MHKPKSSKTIDNIETLDIVYDPLQFSDKIGNTLQVYVDLDEDAVITNSID